MLQGAGGPGLGGHAVPGPRQPPQYSATVRLCYVLRSVELDAFVQREPVSPESLGVCYTYSGSFHCHCPATDSAEAPCIGHFESTLHA